MNKMIFLLFGMILLFISCSDGCQKPNYSLIEIDLNSSPSMKRIKLQDIATIEYITGAGEHTVMSEIRVDELEGFPIGLWVNFSEENKFVTGLNEIIFMLQPMDILDYIDEHAPDAKKEIKKRIQYSSDDQNPVLLIVNLK